MKRKVFGLMAVILALSSCSSVEKPLYLEENACNVETKTYYLEYEDDSCHYEYNLDYPGWIDRKTADRYATLYIANDHRSMVSLMDSLIDSGTRLGIWSNDYFWALQEVFSDDIILSRLMRFHECEPSNISVYCQIANTYNHLGDIKSAIEYFERGIALAPHTSGFRYGLGCLMLQHGDTVSAINHLNKALELAKENNLGSFPVKIQMTIDSIASDIR